jgi:hypothetical protein
MVGGMGFGLSIEGSEPMNPKIPGIYNESPSDKKIEQ